MAIPAIDSYPMPTERDLPTNLVNWRISPRRAVLLVHDLQQYFLQPFGSGWSPLTDLLGNAASLRSRFTDLGVPIAYTAQPGGMTPDERGLLADFWGPGMSRDPEHRRIVAKVAPAPSDKVLTKWRPSAFHRTGLLEWMREQGRDQLVICGVYAHVGILMTAHDGFSHDIQTFVVADAIADFTPEYHRMTLEYVASRCSVTVSTHQALGMLEEDR